MYFVQRKRDNRWVSENIKLDMKPFVSIDEARKFANELPIGDLPEPLRIINDKNEVCGWVSRNGYLPSGALPPRNR